MPVYEAIYNSIHALEDLFGPEWHRKGSITLALLGDDASLTSIEIRDNGIGLNEANFVSFRTYDSGHKVRRGGRGVGRLSWLKVFDHAEIVSYFDENGQRYRRKFRLELDNNRPITAHTLEVVERDQLGTTVLLRNMKAEYAQHTPSKTDTIVKKVAAHFLPYLVSKDKPSIFIETSSETINLSEFITEREFDLGQIKITTSSGDELLLEHNLLEKGLVEGKASHKLYLSANGRVVHEFDIGQALGLHTLMEREGAAFAYAGVLSGELLDENVNSERTAFDLDDEVIEEIQRAALAQIRSILGPQIERVIEQQTDLTRSVIKKYPRYAYIVDDPRTFVEKRVPRNFRTAEQIYQQLAIFDYRENRDIERKVEALSKSAKNEEENANPVEEGVATILGRMTAQEFSVLADYTVRRKVILDLLERRLGYKQDGTMKHFAEEALHSFVVPMRVQNKDVHIDKHNLWILDDKLTYYEHWASDKSLKKTIENSTSNDRPDVLLFGGRTAFHRPGTDQPVVIIEFKKPARGDYSDDENPFTQIYGYIDELRQGRVADKWGGTIQEVSPETPFFCYIVADLTPKLRSWLRMAQINVPLPGGGGFYGYNDDYRAFIQVLSYRYVLKDARLRNEGFFKQLAM
ncbi:MAG: hypothetical protein CMJ15_13365 [Pelagibacterium sp.]|nr:hypothetical protein [Pelagibacterium sp.]